MTILILRPALALTLALSVGVPVLAQPVPDRLQRPSPMSASASHSPLTDIQTLGDRQVMVGDSGHILLLAADGSVTQAKVPVDLLLTAVYFVDDQRGWVVGHDGVILHSDDGGQNWKKQLDGNAINALLNVWTASEATRLQQAVATQPDDKTQTSALENALFAVDDAKASSAAGPSRPLLNLWFRDANQGWAVGAYGMMLSTIDGGQNWHYLPDLDNPDRLHLNAVLGLADGTLLVAGEGGRIYRSADNGLHWQAAMALGPASFYKLLALKNGEVLAMGFGGVLFASHDSGVSWQALSNPVKAGLYGGQQLTDGSLILAGQGGILLYSDDGEHFKVWRSKSKLPWLGIGQVSSTQVVLIGSAGLQNQSLIELKEHLQ
ncbi:MULTISPECIES: YCF48-related protein [unclassified Pseudomonas]|uniref:WD40/YVTN/BNR-like repeat-containing protein n=1 Tax=unclassified Pseudomonas TaxID=196821 RepID=UPI002AC9476C|nr:MULTISPECIES: YCF48-related protein [unclassified Pseudomonas]MEB0039297.1 YCF48-related protein [Pseudomonas sp. MH10]MEB0076055.1 YCF48-related protein [Pseudomonas sp. MH10out]MEB0090839.1 YCF48-related protein [Pseudomonas sp. CCI4.2]MEB0100144.1 YCF48-related protein [Pseudomonas sp. CCI3.2]MEB0119736.1 YCF48-related protein [Pseudomonas sp. CCI1.2]